MLFHSIDFAIFLPLVFILYWFVFNRSLLVQNLLLLVASFVFYGWWDWRYLLLISVSIVADYFIGLLLDKTKTSLRRKGLLLLSIAVNLGLLGYFKYTNFFIDNFNSAFSLFGFGIHWVRLDIVLPIGISFYTFQTLSYTIDVYRKQMKPERSFIVFAGYVSFFPQLVAGPIERAVNLMPQFLQKRRFDQKKSQDGLKQMLWGFFKKLVIANNLGIIVDQVYASHDLYSGSELMWVAILFSIQVYADFSGYSDIAIGLARLFGFDLKQNFNFPFFSRDFSEFWKKWHISLIKWLNTYVYHSLGSFTRVKSKIATRILIVFLLSGFWHGANWTFVFWGILNAFFVIYSLYFNKRTKGVVAKNRLLPNTYELYQMTAVLILFSLSAVTFRSGSINQAAEIYYKIFSFSEYNSLNIPTKMPFILIVFFMSIEWLARERKHGLENLGTDWPRILRWLFYALLILTIGLLVPIDTAPFIYFEF